VSDIFTSQDKVIATLEVNHDTRWFIENTTNLQGHKLRLHYIDEIGAESITEATDFYVYVPESILNLRHDDREGSWWELPLDQLLKVEILSRDKA